MPFPLYGLEPGFLHHLLTILSFRIAATDVSASDDMSCAQGVAAQNPLPVALAQLPPQTLENGFDAARDLAGAYVELGGDFPKGLWFRE